jgi:hypothetical protein
MTNVAGWRTRVHERAATGYCKRHDDEGGVRMSYRSRTVKPSTALWAIVAAANVVVLAFTAGLWLVVVAAAIGMCAMVVRGGRLFQGSPVGYARPAPVRMPSRSVVPRRR